MGELEINPTSDLDIATQPYSRNHHYPFIEVKELPELLAKLLTYKGNPQTVLGLRLLSLTVVRTGELRFSEPWLFDLKQGIWCIPIADVK